MERLVKASPSSHRHIKEKGLMLEEVSDTDTNGWSWSPSATRLSCSFFPRGWSWSPVAGRESGEQPNCWSWSPYLKRTRQKLRMKWSWSPHTIDMPTQVAAFEALRRSSPARRMNRFKLPKHCGEERPLHGNTPFEQNGSRRLRMHVPCNGDDVHDFASVTGLHSARVQNCHSPPLFFKELNVKTFEDGLSKVTDELTVSSDCNVPQTTYSLQNFENIVKIEKVNEVMSCTSDPSPDADGNESFVADGTPPDGTDDWHSPPVLAATTPHAGGSGVVGDDASISFTTDGTDQSNTLGLINNSKDSNSDVKQCVCTITEINVKYNYSSRLVNSENNMNAEDHCRESSSNLCNKTGEAEICVIKDMITINADTPAPLSVSCNVSRKCKVNANADREINSTEAICTEKAEGSVSLVNTANNTEEVDVSPDTENEESAIDNESNEARQISDKIVCDEDNDLLGLNVTDNTAGETLVEMREENEAVVEEHRVLGDSSSPSGDDEMQVDTLTTNIPGQVDVSDNSSPLDEFEESKNGNLQVVDDEGSKKLINTTDETVDVLPTENSVKQIAIDRSSEIAEDDARSKSLDTSTVTDIPVKGTSEDDPNDLPKGECGLHAPVPSTTEDSVYSFDDQREKLPLSLNENSTDKTHEDNDKTHGIIDTIATQRTINMHPEDASETTILCNSLMNKTHDIEPSCQTPVDSQRMSCENENKEISSDKRSTFEMNYKFHSERKLWDVPLKDASKSMDIKNADSSLFFVSSETVNSNLAGSSEDHAHPGNPTKSVNNSGSVVSSDKYVDEGTFDNCLSKPASAFGGYECSDFANDIKVSDMSQEVDAMTFQGLSDVSALEAMGGEWSPGGSFPVLTSQLSLAVNYRESDSSTLRNAYSTPSKTSHNISESGNRFLDLEEQTWNPKSVLAEFRSRSASPTEVRSRMTSQCITNHECIRS
nr:uncharacterized protein LOC113807354 [Penaeus vannamei]